MGLATFVVFGALAGGIGSNGATFPGTNGLITFVTERDGGPNLYATAADGASPRRIAEQVQWSDWSPDGRRIAAISPANALSVMNADGSGRREIVAASSNFLSGPSWSPDGRQIAFGRAGASSTGIFVINADGSGERRVTTDPRGGFDPDWSPDGTRLVFGRTTPPSRTSGFLFEIYVVNVDGSGERQLTTAHPSGSGGDFSPNWSPDARRIVFNRLVSLGNGDILVMNADGTGVVNLTNHPAHEFGPSWSPDGTMIAFGSDADGNLEVYTMRSDGTAATNITNNPAADHTPDWQSTIDVAAALRGRPASTRRGRTATYTAIVQNRSPGPATGASLALRLPVGARVLSARASGGTCRRARPVVCALGTIAAQGRVTVTVRARLARAGSFVVRATATALPVDPNPANNQATARTRVRR